MMKPRPLAAQQVEQITGSLLVAKYIHIITSKPEMRALTIHLETRQPQLVHVSGN